MKIVKENINEKFEEKSDPIKNMGIGGNLYDQYLREEALKFIIPDFQSLLSYYSEYTFG